MVMEFQYVKIGRRFSHEGATYKKTGPKVALYANGHGSPWEFDPDAEVLVLGDDVADDYPDEDEQSSSA